jgi:small-conductance mechanosensitive channel
MTKFAISEEMKNEQYEQLRRSRFPRLALLLLVICALFFLQDREPFRFHFWILFFASIVAGIVGWFFILWIDGKKQVTASGKGLTAPQ